MLGPGEPVQEITMGRPEPCVLFAQTFVHPQLDEYVDQVIFAELVVITACEFLKQNGPSASSAITLLGLNRLEIGTRGSSSITTPSFVVLNCFGLPIPLNFRSSRLEIRGMVGARFRHLRLLMRWPSTDPCRRYTHLEVICLITLHILSQTEAREREREMEQTLVVHPFFTYSVCDAAIKCGLGFHCCCLQEVRWYLLAICLFEVSAGFTGLARVHDNRTSIQILFSLTRFWQGMLIHGYSGFVSCKETFDFLLYRLETITLYICSTSPVIHG